MIPRPASTLEQKIQRWREELLDMSLRNRLLNFQPRSAVRIIAPQASTVFEELVVKGRMISLDEMVKESPGNLAQQPLAADRLWVPHDPRGMDATLKRMRLRARGSIQEQGVNILFLALGMVTWYDPKDRSQELMSPLVLVPVELVKEGPLVPFRVRAIDEDIVVNPNLAYKLKVDLSITLPEWPEELTSLDGFLDRVRASISVAPKWEVEASAHLGLFSFAKLSMYQELLVEHERLAKHPFINALAGDPSLLPALPDHPRADRMDAMVRPADSFQILDADSSQQEAIEMAKRGISFVLQGPPGTGKSQTISNIIAEALAQDKRVLFVSEKMAALEVVKGRLEDKGLGDYTLEIHSQKSSKTAVVEELRRCMMPAPVPPVNVDDLRRLEQVRDEINGYVNALHIVRGPLGRSAFQVLSRLATLHEAPDLPIAIPDVASMRPEDLEARLRLVGKVQAQRALVERMDVHTWRDLRTDGWKAGEEVAVASALRGLKDGVHRVQEITSGAGAAVGMEPPRSLAEGQKLLSLLHRTSSTPYPMESWLAPGRAAALLQECELLQRAYRQKDDDQRWLRERYNEEVRTLDARGLLYRFEAEHRGMLRSLSSRFKADRALVLQQRRDGRRPDHGEVVSDLRRLVSMEERSRELESREASAAGNLGPRFRGPSTDWGDLRNSLTWTADYVIGLPTPLPSPLVQALCDPSGPGRKLETTAQEGDAAAADLSRSLGEMQRYFELQGRARTQDRSFEELTLFAERHLADLPSMREWLEAASLERACRDQGMADLFRIGRDGDLPGGDIVAAFERRSYRLWFEHVCSLDSRLRDFRGEDREDAIGRFRELDERQMAIAQTRLRAKLAAGIELALSAQAEKGSELAVLKRELAKKKRFKQVRQLFQQCPDIILKLKPCLLMSPLSVSQFLDPAVVRFDMVVFDEASQVRPEDAVGSIMRGGQTIVVGDSKQLPPTSFFRSEAGEAEDEELEDLESILDECTALNIMQHMLLWHYRSRHESLIAFSNQRMYDGLLNTFPSAGHEAGEWGVSFVRVTDGVYERGSSRTNPVEARKVAELVFEHFTRTPERSLGVIAFSEAQQMAILDVIDDLRRERPEFEAHFAEDGDEEFFVKNLESVQGDERDVMIFSVGYGRDPQGKMHQNYGPLNTAGGERRLNVAITRARMHIKLVASIGPEDVDGSMSQGARMLRDYIAYAASGGSRTALPGAPERVQRLTFGTEMEDDVHNALTGEGWKVQKHIGCSSYRIDLAVEDPSRPGSYLLGIVCDGDSYRSGMTARDRDRLRDKVLKGLGWNIHHLWSRDWVDHRGRELEKIRAEIARINASRCAPPGNEGASQDTKGDELEGRSLLRTALVDLVRIEGPVDRPGLRSSLGRSGMGEVSGDTFDAVLNGMIAEKVVVARGDFVWPVGMSRPPVRGPRGAEAVVLARVAPEELGEAALYVMGSDVMIAKRELFDRVARFYRHDRLSESDMKRVDDALRRLVAAGYLSSAGSDSFRRPL